MLLALPLAADTLRVAGFNVSLGRDGPGLLARDIARGDTQVQAVAQIIATLQPDILLLSDFDVDYDQIALRLFTDLLAQKGAVYPFSYAGMSNAGLATDLDLDGDGRTGGPGDAQGFGDFPGAQSMALLTRYPVVVDDVRDFSAMLWADVPGAALPFKDGKPFPSAAAQSVQRLSSKGHWDVPVRLPDGAVLHILASNPTPPVFDGPEDRNGLRNRDEIRFWSLYLNGDALAGYPPRAAEAFVLMGDFNADPMDGEGSHDAIAGLLSHPFVADVGPKSRGAVLAAARQGGGNPGHRTDPALDTVDWDEARTGGNMRVDYVLPSADLKILDAGVFWPAPDQEGFELVGLDGATGSHHRLVWIDIAR